MTRRGRGSYGSAFLIGIVLVALAAGYTFWLMRPVTAASEEDAGSLPLEVGDGFEVRNVANIRPTPEAYAKFAEEDRRWRESAVARMLEAMRAERADAPWRASPEQVLDDSVYVLALAGRHSEAADLLRQWLASNPDDSERMVTAARLLLQADRLDEAFASYEGALALMPADATVRMEYAEALLWSGRYVAATDQFQLIAASGDDRAARLGLARALAWSDRAADAEPLLARLWNETPSDTSIRTLLRSTRANIEPSSAVALTWMEADPDHAPYRLMVARSFAREGRFAEAANAFDRVLEDSVTVPLLTEAAGTRAAAGDSVGTARLLGRAVAIAPDDAALRQQHAEALAWSGDLHAAVAEYSRLLAAHDDAGLRLARGRLYLYLGDESSALADLERSAKLSPSYEALAAIGDLYHWRGDYARARAAYTSALAFRPADARALSGLALVRAAERVALAQSVDSPVDEPGWSLAGVYAEDNAGFLLLRTRLAYGLAAGRGTVGSFGVEQHRVSHRSARAPEQFVSGYSMGGALQHYVNRVVFGVGGGVTRHALVRDMFYGRVSASAPIGPVMISLRAATGPAYPELWSLWTLVRSAPDGESDRPIRARTLMASAAVPVGRASVQVAAERMTISDGNRRTSISVAVSQPVSRSFRVLYSAGSLGWSDEGTAYWDPRNYTRHAVGVEYGRAVGSSVTVAARALAGVARSTERVLLVPGTAQVGSSWSPQFTTGVDATYRGDAFEITAGGGYGRGAPRDGGNPAYQSLTGTVRVRIDWP